MPFNYSDIKKLYASGETATISSSVLSQTGADFGDVTDNVDYVYIRKGTGVTPGFYKITAHTTTTLTLQTNPGDSSAGDVVFIALLTSNTDDYTHLTDTIILQLRQDVDYLGVRLGMTGTNWTNNKFDWTKGTAIALDDNNNRLWKSYITDLRTACEEMYTTAGLGTPTWTITNPNLKALYDVFGDIIPGRKGVFTDVRKRS